MNRTLFRLTSLAGLLATGLLACASPTPPGQDREALDATIHRWFAAVNAHDVAALKATMTEDVELSDNLTTARGSDAAIRALGEMVVDGPLAGVTREITVANDIAWHSVGLAQTLKNGVVQGRGLALEIWIRVNGDWKLHRRMATGTPETSLTRPATKEPVLDRPKD